MIVAGIVGFLRLSDRCYGIKKSICSVLRNYFVFPVKKIVAVLLKLCYN